VLDLVPPFSASLDTVESVAAELSIASMGENGEPGGSMDMACSWLDGPAMGTPEGLGAGFTLATEHFFRYVFGLGLGLS
jgi:hypothetical protein